MTYNNSSKVVKKFHCEKCDYSCSKKGDFNKHLNTLKHINTSLALTYNHKLSSNIVEYKCDCGNSYKHRQSLYHHKKKCSLLNIETKENKENKDVSSSEINKDILLMLLKKQDFMEELLFKNQEFMSKVMEIMPQVGNTTNNNMNNCMNKTFNINMFLNEHCKNAMNLSEFIESLPITDKIHENTMKNGLTSTITNMMVDGLNELDILDRPIHCTDTKRKTMYVKENDVWEKDKELIKILTGIKNTALKNRMNLDKWQDANDGWMVKENIQMKYLSLVSNVMTFIEDEDKHVNKIINAIGKKVYLDEDTKKEYM